LSRLFEIKNLSKEFTDSTGFVNKLFFDLNFSFTEGITTILAPVGSGKTTLLKIIAGLQNPTSGNVLTESESLIFIPSQYSIFPWLNVKDNIIYDLKDIDVREFKRVIEIVGLDGYEDHFPKSINSGFVFRVALARSIIRKPDLILVDEPFTDLNPTVLIKILQLVRKIWETESIPVLVGTTNISSALFLSDKIFLMQKNPGAIIYETDVKFNSGRDINLFNQPDFIEKKLKLESEINSLESSKLHKFIM